MMKVRKGEGANLLCFGLSHSLQQYTLNILTLT